MMNSKQMLRAVLCMLSVGLSIAVVSTVAASEMGMAAANEVSLASYQGFLNHSLYTHDGHSRGPTGPQHDPARDNIKALFESYGLPVEFETFTYSGRTYENVVAIQLGSTHPDQEYIIGGHYDSVGNPGADDNASGVALVLEAARILSQYESAYTIRYIAFDMEEVGLKGSQAYVSAHSGDDIRGMISTDMVAYDPGTNHALIYGRTASNPIKNAVGAAIDEYGDGLTSTLKGKFDGSDHAPFELAGYQACLLIEGEFWSNPYYHSQKDSYDTPGYLNFPYAVKMARSVVGYLVDSAGVVVNVLVFTYPNGLPELSSPAGGTTVRVEVSGLGTTIAQPGTGLLHYDVGAGWQSVAMNIVAPNVYDAVLPPATCGAEVLYYFSAEAVGGEVFSDPRNAPAVTYLAAAAYGRVVFFEDDFETNPGWTTQDQWAFGRPTGGGGQYGGPDPTSGHSGNNVYGYNLNGDYPNNLPERHLTSTPIDCTGMLGVHLGFWRWLGVEAPQYDHAYVRVSNDGAKWTTAWENNAEFGDSSWHEMDLDISAVADNQSTVFLRWTMGTTDEGWRYCGWNIDDVKLTALDCEPPQALGDLNCDGAVNFDDIDPFVLALGGQAGYQAQYPHCNWLNADVNGDGKVDFDDIDPFVGLLGG